jgi:hypothetical protein
MEILRPEEADGALASFARAHAGMRIFVRGDKGARVVLAVASRRMYFVFEGECEGAQIVGVINDAKEAGVIVSDDFSAYVDMLPFTGALDWRVIPQIGEVMPKGNTATNKNAYVVRDDITAALTKINSALFSKTEHRAFATGAEALAWLGWE